VHEERVSASWVQEQLAADGYEPTEASWVPGALTLGREASLGRRFEYRAGLIHTQEAASMLPPIALDPKPGELVLDLCAAPGGKSAQLSLLMKGRGTLVVNDLSFARLSALRATQERLGLTNMVLCARNGERLLANHPPCFDKVLVDAPCSCEGTIRKKGRWSFVQERGDFRSVLRATQARLLLNALKLTKVGGRVVYSTCTLDPLENEAVVEEALKRFSEHGGEAQLEARTWEGFKGVEGVTEWGELTFRDEMRRCTRVYPQHNDTGGFFIASLTITQQPVEGLEREGLLERGWKTTAELPQADIEPLHAWTQEVKGLPLSVYEGLSFIQNSRRSASVVAEELLIPPTKVEVSGLPIFHTKGRLPHFTTAAALKWAHLAMRQTLDLSSREEVNAFYRGDLMLIEGRGLERGDVFVRYLGRGIGCGFCFIAEVEHIEQLKQGSAREGELLMSSLYPKALLLTERASAFEVAERP
jgi:NOL1/NOP2/sun family putative RNA methylase